MKTLILLRHAKSDWSQPGLSDHDRPLNGRGRKAAPLMADFIQQKSLRPDVVRCSTSKRTRQTLKPLKKKLPQGCDVAYLEELYHASADEILQDIVSLPQSASTALYVGHNPGMQDLALRLVGEADNEGDRAQIRYKFPTAGLAVFSFDCDDWQEVGFEKGRLRLFAYPKMLPHGV
jgi:phosphohistidine phosphatase